MGKTVAMMQRFNGSNMISIQNLVLRQFCRESWKTRVYEQDLGKYLFNGCLVQNVSGRLS